VRPFSHVPQGAEEAGEAMLRFDGEKQSGVRSQSPAHRRSEGEGLLFLAALVGSWVLALALGWLVWRLSPF
jgi:hypothetical protein